MLGALSTIEGAPPDVLAEVAREFSPRIEICSPTEIVLDLSGLTRLFGEARTIAEELRRTAADRGLRVRVAIAGTRTAARLLVRYRAGLTIVEPGNEAAAVAPLPIALLGDLDRIPDPESRIPDQLATFRRWGLRTLGDLAALPSDDLAARLGRQDTDWQCLARGEDGRPLVPSVPKERFEQTLELEWPIEELEPLSFVLGRLMESLEAHLVQRDRGAAVLHVRLHLIKTDGTTREVHERSLQLPVPIRDARTLRTLALLDLESNPPAAAIDRVTVAVDPTPARIVQFSLLTRPLPSPEQVSTLMARLHALMGETRCGSPETIDSWQPGAFAMKTFMPGPGTRDAGPGIQLRTLGPRTPDPESRIPNPEPRIPSDVRTSPLPPPGPHPCPCEARQAIERLHHGARLERGNHRLVRRPLANVWRVVGHPSPESRIPGPRSMGSRRVGRRACRWPDLSALPRTPFRQVVPRGRPRLVGRAGLAL